MENTSRRPHNCYHNDQIRLNICDTTAPKSNDTAKTHRQWPFNWRTTPKTKNVFMNVKKHLELYDSQTNSIRITKRQSGDHSVHAHILPFQYSCAVDQPFTHYASMVVDLPLTNRLLHFKTPARQTECVRELTHTLSTSELGLYYLSPVRLTHHDLSLTHKFFISNLLCDGSTNDAKILHFKTTPVRQTYHSSTLLNPAYLKTTNTKQEQIPTQQN